MPTGSITTFHLFRVPAVAVPVAVARMALDRWHLQRTPGVSFHKHLGTGDGRTFSPRDADPRTWGMLAVWTDAAAVATFERSSPVAEAWRRIAVERWRLDLHPLAAHGRWSGREPFTVRPDPALRALPDTAASWEGPVAAITRARLRLGSMRSFWGAVPPVTEALHESQGLRLAIGIGEAPVGLQGTLSVWDSSAALRAFAYRDDAHRQVIRRTASDGWYAEELFARFAVVQSTGTVGGRDPLG
jgi:heme-degrading monooxygenase HmoA